MEKLNFVSRTCSLVSGVLMHDIDDEEMDEDDDDCASGGRRGSGRGGAVEVRVVDVAGLYKRMDSDNISEEGESRSLCCGHLV